MMETIHRHNKRRSRSRTLVLMIDSRNVSTSPTTDFHYHTLAILINYHYAKLHDYDFLLVQPNSSDLLQKVAEIYHTNPEEAIAQQKEYLKDASHHIYAHESKQAVSLYHPQLHQFRSSPWGRLPVLWHIARLHHLQIFSWKSILYLDSDAIIATSQMNRSLEMAIQSWRNQEHPEIFCADSMPEKGSGYLHGTIDNSSIIFLSNAPWGDIAPCTGTIVFQLHSPKILMHLLSVWWDHDASVFNFRHCYEQCSLWQLLTERHPLFSTHTTYIHHERQFPDIDAKHIHCDNNIQHENDKKGNIGWVCHLGSFCGTFFKHCNRKAEFENILRIGLGLSNEALNQHVNDILEHHTVQWNAFEMVQAMPTAADSSHNVNISNNFSSTNDRKRYPSFLHDIVLKYNGSVKVEDAPWFRPGSQQTQRHLGEFVPLKIIHVDSSSSRLPCAALAACFVLCVVFILIHQKC